MYLVIINLNLLIWTHLQKQKVIGKVDLNYRRGKLKKIIIFNTGREALPTALQGRSVSFSTLTIQKAYGAVFCIIGDLLFMDALGGEVPGKSYPIRNGFNSA